MAVKMRLMRMGKTKSPHYRVVVIDGRAPRDGRYIDLIGRYDPRQEPSLIDIDAEKAVDWLRKGAQPTEAVSKILDASGALTQFKVKSGKIHTISAPTPAPAPAAPADAGSGAGEGAATTGKPRAEADAGPEDEPDTDVGSSEEE
jgi:small subunit ribosomal protein S16